MSNDGEEENFSHPADENSISFRLRLELSGFDEKRIEKAFMKMNKSGDGTLSADEFKRLAEKVLRIDDISKSDILSIMQSINSSSNGEADSGEITLDGFKVWCKQGSASTSSATADDAGEEMEVVATATTESKDSRTLVDRLHLELSGFDEKRIEKAFMKMNKSGDGTLSADEFKRLAEKVLRIDDISKSDILSIMQSINGSSNGEADSGEITLDDFKVWCKQGSASTSSATADDAGEEMEVVATATTESKDSGTLVDRLHLELSGFDEKRIEKAFMKMNKSGDGTLSADEFKRLAEKVLRIDDISKSDILSIMQSINGSSNGEADSGEITLDGFKVWCKQGSASTSSATADDAGEEMEVVATATTESKDSGTLVDRLHLELSGFDEKRIEKAFMKMNKSGDGTLSADEFKRLAEKVLRIDDISKSDILSIMQSINGSSNGEADSGEITLDGFKVWCKQSTASSTL